MAKIYGTMLALAFFAFLVTVTPSLASPSIVGRQTPNCPSNGTDEDNFMLRAINKADLSIQKQLALVSDGSSSSSGLIGSADSLTSVISSNFYMANGGVTAIKAGLAGIITGVSNQVFPNGLLSFTLAENARIPRPTEGVYCVLSHTDPNGTEFPLVLSVRGDYDNFSLCQRSNSNESVVVHNSFESITTSAGPDLRNCTNIYIAVLRVRQEGRK